MSGKDKIMNEIEAVVQEVQELLRKSGMPMEKEDMPEENQDQDDSLEQPSESPEMEQEQEGAPEQEGSPEEMPQEGEQESSMEDELKNLNDEELDHLIQALMAEKDSRSAAQAPEQVPEAAPAPEMPPAEKSMKEEYSKLGKSLEVLGSAIDALNKKVDAITAPAQKPKVTVKAPSASSQDVQVLQKSRPAQKRLTKSETIDFLEKQLSKGNKLVDRNVMLDVCTVKSEDELHQVQDSLIKQGIEFPKL